jgi:uncharacterized membrane protein YGL010W
MSPALRTHFSEYADFHRTAGNQACHYVGIPLIMVSLFALLAQWPLFTAGGITFTAAEALIVAATLYYLTLDAALAFMMLAASLVMAALGRRIPWTIALALFVLGWIFQFAGHSLYEKRSPAFLRNFVHLLIGPLWILAKAVGRA